MSPRPRPTSVPSGILVHPAIWPQQTWAENWVCAPFWGAGFPSNTMWPGPSPTSTSSGILIRPTIWPQYANVTDRQPDRETGQTAVRWHRANRFTNGHQKWLNRSRYRLGCGLRWVQGSILDRVHIVAACRTRLNRLCAAAMWPFVRLLWPLVICATIVKFELYELYLRRKYSWKIRWKIIQRTTQIVTDY